MSSLGLTLYVLFWPTIALLVLLTLCYHLYRDIERANRNGEDLV